jgi:phage shock protein A
MPEDKRNDLVTKLADLSEEALHRLQEAPGGDRFVNTLNSLRDRIDEMQRRIRGIDELEKRLSALERKVDKLAKGAGSDPAGRGAKTAKE